MDPPASKGADIYLVSQVLLAWTLTNAGLVAGILSTSAGSKVTSTQSNVYMAVLLYSVAGELDARPRLSRMNADVDSPTLTGLAAVRFLGSTFYSIVWLFAR